MVYVGSGSSTSHQRQRSPWLSRLTFLMFRPQPHHVPDPRFIHHRNGISEFQTSPRMSKLIASVSPNRVRFALHPASWRRSYLLNLLTRTVDIDDLLLGIHCHFFGSVVYALLSKWISSIASGFCSISCLRVFPVPRLGSRPRNQCRLSPPLNKQSHAVMLTCSSLKSTTEIEPPSLSRTISKRCRW